MEPTTEKEWAFLRNCALNKYDDFWVDDGAVQTLRLIASPQSQQVLKEVAKVNTGRAGYIREALQYIESGPAPLSDEDAVCAGKKLAQAVKIGSWQGNKKPRFNEARDKALIDCEFVTGRDLLVQTATFHSVDGKWKLRGVRETMHATLSLKDETHGMPDAQP